MLKEHQSRWKKNQSFLNFLDRTTFFRLFVFWIFIMMLFGVIYFSAEFNSDTPTGFFAKVYSSFTHGTGSSGANGILSVANLIIGMVMMSLITTKLVSLKHEKILDNIHEISMSEKVNRISNQLDEIKKDAFDMVSDIEKKDMISRKDLFEIRGNVSKLRNNLSEIDDDLNLADFEKPHLEMLSNGIYHCLQNVSRLQNHMKKNSIVFRNTSLLDDLYSLITRSSKISKNFRSLEIYSELSTLLDEMYSTLGEFNIASKEFDSVVSPLIRP